MAGGEFQTGDMGTPLKGPQLCYSRSWPCLGEELKRSTCTDFGAEIGLHYSCGPVITTGLLCFRPTKKRDPGNGFMLALRSICMAGFHLRNFDVRVLDWLC